MRAREDSSRASPEREARGLGAGRVDFGAYAKNVLNYIWLNNQHREGNTLVVGMGVCMA